MRHAITLGFFLVLVLLFDAVQPRAAQYIAGTSGSEGKKSDIKLNMSRSETPEQLCTFLAYKLKRVTLKNLQNCTGGIEPTEDRVLTVLIPTHDVRMLLAKDIVLAVKVPKRPIPLPPPLSLIQLIPPKETMEKLIGPVSGELEALKKQLVAMELTITELRSRNESLRDELTALKKRLESAAQQTAVLSTERDYLLAEKQEQQSRQVSYRISSDERGWHNLVRDWMAWSWFWHISASVVIGMIGGGWLVSRRRNRSKSHQFKDRKVGEEAPVKEGMNREENLEEQPKVVAASSSEELPKKLMAEEEENARLKAKTSNVSKEAPATRENPLNESSQPLVEVRANENGLKAELKAQGQYLLLEEEEVTIPPEHTTNGKPLSLEFIRVSGRVRFAATGNSPEVDQVLAPILAPKKLRWSLGGKPIRKNLTIAIASSEISEKSDEYVLGRLRNPEMLRVLGLELTGGGKFMKIPKTT